VRETEGRPETCPLDVSVHQEQSRGEVHFRLSVAPKEATLRPIGEGVGRRGVVPLLSCLLGGGQEHVIKDLVGLRETETETERETETETERERGGRGRALLDRTLLEDEAMRRSRAGCGHQ
jgi:hypothetical protein